MAYVRNLARKICHGYPMIRIQFLNEMGHPIELRYRNLSKLG